MRTTMNDEFDRLRNQNWLRRRFNWRVLAKFRHLCATFSLCLRVISKTRSLDISEYDIFQKTRSLAYDFLQSQGKPIFFLYYKNKLCKMLCNAL